VFFPSQLLDSNSGCIYYPFHMCCISSPHNLPTCDLSHNFQWSKYYEALRFAIFSNLALILLKVPSFSSALSIQTPSSYVPPVERQNKLHTSTQQQKHYIVTCFLLTRRIICGLRILYLDLLDLHQASFTITYNTSNFIT
jgi:hypothetical protein